VVAVLAVAEKECNRLVLRRKVAASMKTLSIKWQRLLSGGETCPRCGSTEEEVNKAVEVLRQSFTLLDVSVVLDKVEISDEEFAKDPLQSNAISMNDRLLEDWLGATTGQSECCEVCGPNDCRTLDVAGDVHEVIPAGLIIKAALLAAAQLVDATTCDCYPPAIWPAGGCCPK
jgi:hypothetical protein